MSDQGPSGPHFSQRNTAGVVAYPYCKPAYLSGAPRRNADTDTQPTGPRAAPIIVRRCGGQRVGSTVLIRHLATNSVPARRTSSTTDGLWRGSTRPNSV